MLIMSVSSPRMGKLTASSAATRKCAPHSQTRAIYPGNAAQAPGKEA
jgi:hypothetical protein